MKTKVLKFLNLNAKSAMTYVYLIFMGLALPAAVHAIGGQAAGQAFMPLYVPVVLASMLCGPVQGVVFALTTPLISNAITGMPPMALIGGIILKLLIAALVAGVVRVVVLGIYAKAKNK